MTHTSKLSRTPSIWLLSLLALAPVQLGAKGCDVGHVGNDGCPSGECGSGGNLGAGNPKTCGGLAGASCAAGEYCDFPADALCGSSDATGACKARPDACAEIYAPVCGCDGKTYGNECGANSAGVSVAHEGECSPGGGVVDGGSGRAGDCGGLLGLTCGQGEFCNYAKDAHCGAADATGVCTEIPDACDAVYAPVCGCDGKTYGNECEANSAGVSVARDGECDGGGGGDDCGGLLGLTCGQGEFCNYAKDAQCGFADATGVCTETPDACDTVYAPVCGCDGTTYGNECEANRNGVSVAHDGECDGGGDEPEFCGGFAGFTCPDGEFCNYPPAANCGSGDMTGECEPIPQGCTEEYAPVCGCDGKTYSNACNAAQARVSVASSGECP